MKFLRYIVLSVLALALGVAVLAGQFAFRVERTMLSYRYMSAALERTLIPLEDDEIRKETVLEAVRDIRRRLSLPVPRELDQYIGQAAIQAFGRAWIARTLDRMLYSLIRVVNGREDELALAISISGF